MTAVIQANMLGATLYVPVTRSDLLEIASGRHGDLRSIVVCLEDAIREDEVAHARHVFAEFILAIAPIANRIIVYARPRDPAMLAWMLDQPGIEGIDGFVLPKVATGNIDEWLVSLDRTDHALMPTIEGCEAFDRGALIKLAHKLLYVSDRITAIRIGGNDILNLLGARRSRTRTAYDGPLGAVIRDIANTFIPAGFAVAAPVFEHYGSIELLREEVEQDIEHGLLTKTAIHPCQIGVIHACYRPSEIEVEEARMLKEADSRAVFGSMGSMCEPATHRRWADTVLARASQFGVAVGGANGSPLSPMKVA